MMALQLQAPEFELTDKEASKLAEAGANVAAWYNFDLSGSNRAWDHLALAYTATLIYLPRISRFAARKKNEMPGAVNLAAH
jgi:hypothetical protein